MVEGLHGAKALVHFPDGLDHVLAGGNRGQDTFLNDYKLGIGHKQLQGIGISILLVEQNL